MPLSNHSTSFGTRVRLAAAHAPVRPALPEKPALSAWQHWEMGTLLEAAATLMPLRKAGQPAAEPLANKAELERLRLEAKLNAEAERRRDAWAQGHAEGHNAGLAAGLAAASVHTEHLRALAMTLPDALRRAEADIADAVLALALDVARQVIHRTLAVETDWLLSLVQDLLHTEPALQGEPRLLLHPDDVALVKNALGNELQTAGWQVRADDTMTRGGCRVQSSSGELDASLETRWERMTAKLGACRALGIDSEKEPQRGQFLPNLQAHSPAMGQKDGEKWAAVVDLQPTIPKSDRLPAPRSRVKSSSGELDASLTTRWERVTAALGAYERAGGLSP